MINKTDHIRRYTCADMNITQVIRKSLSDNFERIPYTNEGGYIATDIGEKEDDEHLLIMVSGFLDGAGIMMQEVTVVYFDTIERANRFRRSEEGRIFGDRFSDGKDCFDYTTFAGNPALPNLIATILRNHFNIKDNSYLIAHTYCNVDYFRKDTEKKSSIQQN